MATADAPLEVSARQRDRNRWRKGVLTVALYRFQRTFRRRRGAYLSLVLLIGLVGGLSMGALAAARRTESSFPTFLATTNPSNLSVATALWNPALGYATGYNGPLVATIARLPDVRRAESYSGIYSEPIGANGEPTSADQNANFDVNGSVDGLYFNLDRVTVLQGRMADPKRANEIMMTVGAADALGLHVGQTVTWGTYTNSQFESAANAPPALHERLTLVGTVVLNNAVVQDEIDANGPTTVIFTPALTRRLENCCANYTFTFLQLDQGSRDVTAVEAELERVIPAKLPHDFYDASIDVTKAQNAIKPEAIALAVFGLIAGLAAILIAGQVIGRQLGFWAPEERTLRALGANPFMTAGDGLFGIMGAVVVGALVAAAVAVALSPLAPLGPVRPYYPDPGVAFDWTVLGLGVVVLVVVLGSVAIVLAVQRAPQRTGTRRRPRAPSRIEGAASAGGLPVSAVTGIRFALEPGAESEAVPVRSAILGATLAVVVIIATVVFGTSLNSLVSHPRLYGWNWNYALMAGGGVGDIPAAPSATLLDHDPSVAAWSGYWFGNLQIDGLTVPVLGGSPGATVAPPILTGHGFDGPGQIVLGPGTLAQIHKSVGDSVTVRYGTTTPHLLRIVGTATMPAVGVGGVTGHASMGTGAVVPYQLLPASVRNQFSVSPAGPNAEFVRLKPGANAKTALRSLNRIAAEVTLPGNNGSYVLGVERPAEIVNYHSMGATPLILGLGLTVGAVTALGLTLVASVRRRRRSMAMLRTLGFTGGQLRASVAWQSSVAVVIGLVIGVPLGIVAGRFLWDLFATNIYVVPRPTVPALAIVAIAFGALVLGNLVAALPGRTAARTPAALLLRTE
jgi:MacB-like periplasmic core domain/FtsX-like permease family